MKENFKRGSEWRLWDLHIHTPYSHLYNGFGNDWDTYVKELFKRAIANNVSAIGITDYFTIDGYKKIKTEYFEKEDKLKELFNSEEIEKIKSIYVLPNIEFRLNKLVGSNRINFHVLLSDDISFTDIEENFLHEIDFIYEAAPQSEDEKRKLKKNNLEKLGEKLIEQHTQFKGKSPLYIGMMNAVVDDKQICEILANKRNIFEGKYLIALPSDEDLSNVSWNGQDHQARKLLIQKSDILIATNPNTIQWALGKKHPSSEDFINEFKSLKACIGGSDAHTFDELFTKNQDRKVWIKSDLTFEGLKQIIYEPEERVKIQNTNPAYDFEKSAFTEIEIENPVNVFENEQLQFEKNRIPLNQNLVTIIGGRGAGKSVLINYFANGFKQYNVPFEKSEFNLSSDFKVKWKKSLNSTDETFPLDTQYDLPFLFISQSEVKEKVKDAKGLGEEIKKILELETLSFDQKIDETIQNYRSEFNTILEWFNKRDENNNPINQKSYIQQEIDKNRNLLDRITTEENKEKLQKYTANIEKLQDCESEKLSLEQLKTSLTEFLQKTNEQITKLNKGIPLLDFKPQIDGIDAAIKNIDDTIKEAQEENAKIKNDFKDYKGDIASLLSNVERFRHTISSYERRKKEIEEKENQRKSALNNKKKIADLIYSELLRHKSTIDQSWSRLLQGKEGWNEQQKELMKKIINNREIKIEGEIVFDINAFYDLVKEQLDGRIFKGKNSYEELKGLVGIIDLENYLDFLRNIDTSFQKIENYLRSNRYEFEKIFYDLQSRSKYLYVQPKITYKGKPLNKISVGQRGTIYLCLKLATNIFSQPIIFDQPEDDLDNDFIFNDLTDIFKEIKKYRQVIIVTHNANLVVNADAEQVIVATNNEEKLSYDSGSLENPVINTAVCNILEGGKIAFQRRKNKYHLNK
ncbi:MAG: TrlF family AAA-like ATPase [Thermaurantimonas sp.]|uniref:TrlF family AAA-like ATPase n=1 Tax=Thermaurantimonas sp. TaxID=2681568 RepID=UPI00391C61F8